MTSSVSDVHLLHRPAVVHLLKERAGKKYTAKCGYWSEEKDAMQKEMTGSYTRVTCDDCDGSHRAE